MDLDGHEGLRRRVHLDVVDWPSDRILEEAPVRMHPDSTVYEHGQVGPEPAQPEVRGGLQGADPLEEDEHPRRHSRDQPHVLPAGEARGGCQAAFPVGNRGDGRAGRVVLPNPRGQPPRGQARQIAHLGMPSERLGPGAAAQEEHRAVQGLRAPDAAEGHDEGVEPALPVRAECLGRDGNVLVAGGRARGLAVLGGPSRPEDATLARDGPLDEGAHVQVGGDRGTALVVGDASDVPEPVLAAPDRVAGAAHQRSERSLLDRGAGRARLRPSGGAAGPRAR